MSTITEITKTGNNLVTNYDTTKIALGDNKFITAEYHCAITSWEQFLVFMLKIAF